MSQTIPHCKEIKMKNNLKKCDPILENQPYRGNYDSEQIFAALLPLIFL